MPTLEFKGKPFVYAHHLSVPFRELVIAADKSLPGADGPSLPGAKAPSLDDNLIIHGDNLEALKALLPKYAGKVDCIFIDPPYNTGNEGWAYNDNVNSPLMKAWLGKAVDGEDLERHDKWACMMWPRWKLLHELLSDDGSIWMTLDENEMHHARILLEEIFGSENFVANVIWQKRFSPSNDELYISTTHDNLLVFAKRKEGWNRQLLARSDAQNSLYGNPDNDTRGIWGSDNYVANKSKSERPNSWFSVIRPADGKEIWPSPTSVWRYSKEQHERNVAENKVWWGESGLNGVPRFKRFLHEIRDGVVPQTLWFHEEVGHNQGAKQALMRLFPESELPFQTPKPVELIERVLRIAAGNDSIILDSFAGSGTTAHAVLAANAKDDGDRKFILIETEDYADTLTAERVRRVAKGYRFKGSQKTELLRENVTWTKLKNADALLAKVAGFDNLDAHRFDRIEKTVKDGELIVTGVIDCDETAPGLGGSFTYCELGEPMDMARFFDGATPPAFGQVARYVAYTATGATLDVVADPHGDGADHFVGEAGGYRLHLIYRADAGFMRSDDAMLDMATAERIAAAGAGSGKPILVFAAGKYMGQKQLTAMGLTFCQLPYAIHRMLPGDGDGE